MSFVDLGSTASVDLGSGLFPLTVGAGENRGFSYLGSANSLRAGLLKQSAGDQYGASAAATGQSTPASDSSSQSTGEDQARGDAQPDTKKSNPLPVYKEAEGKCGEGKCGGED